MSDKNKQKYYYKVVSEDLKSAIVNRDERYCVQYKIDEFVKTNFEEKGLLVFKYKKATIDFSLTYMNKRIFKCECKNKIFLHKPHPLNWETNWNDAELKDQMDALWDFGDDTLAFEQVKLLEEVKI